MNMPSRLRPIVLACGVVLAAIVAPAAAEPQFPPGSGIGLEPPPGMAVATGFLGFQAGLASIVIVEMPAVAYPQIVATRSRFAERIDQARFEDLAVNGVRGFIVRGRQTAGDHVYRKWAVVLGASDHTALVTAQVPVDDRDISDAAVDAALRSIVFRPQPSQDAQIAALPFVVKDFAGFRSTGALMGATLSFTEGPKDVDPEITQPNIIVATSLNHPPEKAMDRLDFAVAVLKSLRSLRTTQVTSAKLLDANGAQWAHLTATGTRGRSDTAVDISFFLRFGEGDFIIVTATARPGSAYAERFRRLALSVTPKD